MTSESVSDDVQIDWEPFFELPAEVPSFNDFKTVLSREIGQEFKETLQEQFRTHFDQLDEDLEHLKHYILSHTLRAIMVSCKF